VIALSRDADSGFAAHMLAAGALGYLTSRSSNVEVITAVKEVAKDNLYCCLETGQLPVPTPAYISSFKKAINSLRGKARKKINEADEIYWHGIPKFTN